MRHVAAVRKRLGTPTIFNILGPLANPAAAPLQLLGVGHSELQPLLAEALVLLGCRRGLVVHGRDGLDEVTLSGPTEVVEVFAGGLRQFCWTPGDFGLPAGNLSALEVAGPAQSAAIIRDVLSGRPGRGRDIVVANAAAALFLAGKHPSPVLRPAGRRGHRQRGGGRTLGPAGRADPGGLDTLECPGLRSSHRRQAVVN